MDRSLGVPLVGLLACLRRPRPRPRRVESIGFLLLGAIGDTLLAATVIAALRKQFPAARFTWFVNDSNRSFAKILAGDDPLISLPLGAPLRALGLVRAHPLDVLVDFGPWPRISAIFAALSRAQFTVGFNTAGQSRHQAFDKAVLHSSQCHEMENFHALAEPILGHATSGWPHLVRPPGPSSLPSGHRYIVFHPWPAGYKHQWRAWPEDCWLALGKQVKDQGYNVVITGGPSDRSASEALAAKLGTEAISVAGISISETLKVLADAAGVVAVNTGVMHLAAAFDRPLVALHGPTNPKRWGPLSANAVALGPGIGEGCAYLDLGFEYPDNPPDCMGWIGVEDVVQALRRLTQHS